MVSEKAILGPIGSKFISLSALPRIYAGTLILYLLMDFDLSIFEGSGVVESSQTGFGGPVGIFLAASAFFFAASLSFYFYFYFKSYYFFHGRYFSLAHIKTL